MNASYQQKKDWLFIIDRGHNILASLRGFTTFHNSCIWESVCRFTQDNNDVATYGLAKTTGTVASCHDVVCNSNTVGPQSAIRCPSFVICHITADSTAESIEASVMKATMPSNIHKLYYTNGPQIVATCIHRDTPWFTTQIKSFPVKDTSPFRTSVSKVCLCLDFVTTFSHMNRL